MPEVSPDPEATKNFIAEWKKRGFHFAGVTESFRGYDGIQVIAAAIKKAGSTDSDAIRKAMWDIKVPTLNGEVAFAKSGPSGKESGQSVPQVHFVKIVQGKVQLLR